MPISRSDEALAFAAKNGNSKCFDELYKRYYDKIYALAMTVVKNSADAADMLELTFIKAWEQLPHLENTALFHTWLHRIALVQCHAAIRQRKPLTPADADTAGSELLQVTADLMLPEAYAERAELSEQLRTTVEALPPEQRETLLLYYYNRLDTEEIAQAMDCTAETVQVQLYFAREAIRASVKEPETHAGAAAYAAAVPFAAIFVSQIQQLLLSPQTAAAIYQIILQGILQPSAVIPLASAVLQATSSAAGAAGAVAQGAAVAAGTAQGTAGAAAQGAAVAAKGAAVATKGAAVAAKVTAAQGAAAAAKAGVPLATKIVAGVVAAGVVTGGSVVAWRALHTNPIVNAQVGEEITLGTCEQDNNTENGAENIIWRVLAREDDKLLAVSKYVLDGAEHAQLGNNPMWSATGLRQTLNETFFAQSFSEEEQRYICDAYLLSEDSWGRQKDDEVSVEKVFILTLEETQRYFSSDEARAAEATAYAAARGARTDDQNRAAWWVRSIEFENDQGMVKEDGTASGELGGHSGMTLGVRPAIWIDTKAIADGGNARSVVPPFKTTTLPKSLQTFINTFGTHYFYGTFDCEKVTPESNILLGVIGESECVDYSLYSDVLAEQNKFDNWVHAIQTPSPIKDINDLSSTYKVLDAEPVDMILKTIFHCTEENIQTLRGMTGTLKGANPYGYADGKYYSATGGHGDIGFDISRKDGYYRDGCGYYTLELKPGVPVAGLEQPVTMYVKVSLLPHEGKPWWSLYYYSQDPFDGAGYQGSEYHAAYARALFLHRPDAEGAKKLARGSDNTQSSAVPLTALADICGDETPELLYAGTGDRENTSDYPFIHIAGIESGEIKELYTTVADAAQPFDVSIVMNRKTGELFQYTAFRVKDGGSTAVYRLHEDNGQLRPEEILHENMVIAARPGEGHYEYSCRVNGADVSKDAYDSAWSTFKSGIDTVVLHCATNKTLGGYAFSDLPSLSKSFDALQTRLIYRLRP